MDLISAVRLETGDTNPESGILPGRRQFQDSEILYAAKTEGVTDIASPSDRDIGRVTARVFEIASQSWASQPEEVELGPSLEKGKQSVTLSKKASVLRAIWGNGNADRGDAVGRPVPNTVSVGFYYVPPGTG